MLKIAQYVGITSLIIYSFVATMVATFFGTLVWYNNNYENYEYRPLMTREEPPREPDVGTAARITQPTPIVPNKQISPEKSLQVLNILNGLQGFSSQRGFDENLKNIPPIQVFFDPRCPYCHKLFDKLDGKVPVHWIPVAALSPVENGRPIVTKLLNERDGNNSTENLKKYFDAGKKENNAEISPDLAEKYQETLNENYDALALMSRQLPAGSSAGVPLIIIPRANGQIETTVGYSDGDEDKIIKSFGK